MFWFIVRDDADEDRDVDIEASDERFRYEGDGPGWAERLLPLQDELLRGDPRPLYLGWLARWSRGEIEAEDLKALHEPPLPAGLRALTPAQEALVEFVMIDVDLLGAAATTSPSLPSADAK